MIPDFKKAATQAVRALLKYGVDKVPVYPQQVLQKSKVATMISFADLAEMSNVGRDAILSAIHADNDICISYVNHKPDGTPRYIFAFNREQPIERVRLAMAVELGHVYLGHVGYRDDETRMAEAKCFAHHFAFPRAVIKLLEERGFVFTEQNFTRIFGGCEWCIENLLDSEPVTIPGDLNWRVKKMFTPYVDELEATGMLNAWTGPFKKTQDKELDFSKYMAGYEE